MKAMLLAAGRGERMGPLTADRPKPLLSLGAETLIERHLRRLAAARIGELVINLSYRGGQIRSAVGDTTRWGQTVAWSEEGEPPLETAGGIVHALALLGDEPFGVVSTDVVTDFDFSDLAAHGAALERVPDASGYLVLVPNPPHHPGGDFGLSAAGRLTMPAGGFSPPAGGPGTPAGGPDTPAGGADPTYTYSGIAVLSPGLFHGLAPGITPLRDVLRPAVRRGALLGGVFHGLWHDVGTPQRLAQVRALMAGR